MTIAEALHFGARELDSTEKGQLDATVLLEAAIGRDRTYVIAYDDNSLTEYQEKDYRAFIDRRKNCEPVAYITGEKEFYGIPFIVDRRVLIPRPETELLIDEARKLITARGVKVVADIGTGSGCIAIALALNEPTISVFGVDTSKDALKVAKLNLNRHRLNTRVKLKPGTYVPEEVIPDLIVANLPYLNAEEMSSLSDDIRLFEPLSALDGGPDGFDCYRALFQLIRDGANQHATILIEISPVQSEIARTEAERYFPGSLVRVCKDLALFDRVVVIER